MHKFLICTLILLALLGVAAAIIIPSVGGLVNPVSFPLRASMQLRQVHFFHSHATASGARLKHIASLDELSQLEGFDPQWLVTDANKFGVKAQLVYLAENTKKFGPDYYDRVLFYYDRPIFSQYGNTKSRYVACTVGGARVHLPHEPGSDEIIDWEVYEGNWQ